MVGARSALFLPFHELGLVVLDEEHDGAYKQSDGVNYHARDMAVVRARFAEARVILSSATPSVESRNNANTGRYAHVLLTSRFAAQRCPTSPRSTCARSRPRRASGSRRASPAKSSRRSIAASRRCCSSTAAAMPR